jgi:hypothetical protein
MAISNLRGDRCACRSCGLTFRSTAAFDAHRRGKYGVDRRCLTEAELTERGYLPNKDGFWRQVRETV